MWKAFPFVLALLAAGQATAAPLDARCAGSDDMRERIAGCTAIIDGGEYLGRELSMAYARRGHAFTLIRDLTRAGQDLDKAVQVDPGNVIAWTNRANYFYVAHKGEQAMRDANKAVALDPNLPLTYFVRAAAAMRLENYDRRYRIHYQRYPCGLLRR